MRKIFSKMDITLLITTIVLVAFGLVMIYSASNITAVVRYGYEPAHFFIRQAIFIIVALIGGIFVLNLPTRTYNTLSWPMVIGIIFLLFYVLATASDINSAKSWIELKYFNLQPSEFAKSILIIFSAVYYNNLNTKKVKNISLYFIPPAVAIIMFGLILKQPDLGSGVIIAGIALMMFLSVPYIIYHKKEVGKILGVGLVIMILAIMLFGNKLLNDNQMNRLKFREPCMRYTESTGYQVCNGFIAINNGGLFGVGLGNSTQKYLYLPESHTDFIFPIVVEEMGLLVSIVVLGLYVLMLYRIFKIAKSSENLRCSLIAYGTFWYLTLHILVNLLGVLALIPLTGVPLPFLSYGGSFNINAIVMIFLVERACIENNINKTKREIKAL